jgi:hypothetical protein
VTGARATTDWFDHSCVVPAPARDAVSRRLDDYAADLRDNTRDLVELGARFVISGSLARGEPAVAHGSDGWTLSSDLDVVVVGPGDVVAKASAELKTRMLHRAPDLATTTFAVDVAQLPHVQSFVAVDLAHRWHDPLAGATGPSPAPFQSEPRLLDHLELLAHQVSGWLFYPDEATRRSGVRHFRAHRAAHTVKALLEALRLRCASAGVSATRYGSLLTPAALGALSPVPESFVRELVGTRELTSDESRIEADLPTMVLLAVSAFLGCAALPADAIRAAAARAQDTSDLLGLFPLAVLVLTVAPPHTRAADEAEATVRALLASVPEAHLPTARDARARLLDSPALGERLGAADLDAWMQVREDYYTRLGNKNFGRLMAFRSTTTSTPKQEE